MEKFTNKQGYFLALIVATIYSLIMEKHFELLGFIANFIAIIVISSILSGILMLIFRSKKIGKFLGITTLIISILSFIGNKYSDSLKEKEKRKTEEIQTQKETNINLITSNFKNVYTDFSNKLQTDSRKDILNQIMINNEIAFGDSEIVLKKINDANEYYEWIKKMNDSLIHNITTELDKYKEKNILDEREKTEIQKIVFGLEMTKANATMNNMNTYNVIFSMRNLLSIKKNCKHEIKDGKILFFENKCLEKWNKAEVQLNEAIQRINNYNEK